MTEEKTAVKPKVTNTVGAKRLNRAQRRKQRFGGSVGIHEIRPGKFQRATKKGYRKGCFGSA